MSRTYATEPEYATWLGAPSAPSGAARLLRDASLEVDEMLLTAHYNVDHDGRPTDEHVIAALRDATCAQAEHRAEHGDDVTIIENSGGVSLGPLRFGAGTSNGNTPPIPQHSPHAVRILRLAGLIPGRITDG
ncbi:MAG: hypothetical protein WDA07_14215 [Leucobacter sp.]